MLSEKTPTTTFKPQSDKELAAGDRVAGACSREPSRCDGSWLFPELCVLGDDNGPPQSMSERRPCMSSTTGAEIFNNTEIPDTHQQKNGTVIKKAADDGEPPTTTAPDHRVNVFGNGYPPPPPPRIYDGEEEGGGGGSGGGINEGEEGTVAGRKKRTWTAEEDEKLKRAVEEHGSGNWMIIERCSGLGRTSKSCRLRWTNHLRPNLKKGSFSEAEERIVVMLHQKYGNKWSFIASKLPGRTDNEVKNFWHGRLRRCRKQYLDVYPPPIQVDEKFPLSDLNNNSSAGNNFHDQQIHGSAALTDHTTNLNNMSQFPSSCYPNQKPSTISTDPNQNHLLLPNNQVPVSLPPHHHHHGLSSSSSSYTTHHQMQHALPPINTAQSQLHSNIILHPNLSTEPPPPPFSKFSSPEQDSISPGPSSSVSGHKLQVTSQLLASQVSSHFNSITKGSPIESASQPQYLSARQTTNTISQMPSSVSCSYQKTSSQANIQTTAPSPHSPLELKVTTQPPPYHSYFEVNPSMTTSSPICISPKLEIPVTSPASESLNETWLNSTLELAKPYSTDFELPESQSSPSNFNRGSSISNFTSNPELPSFQSPENASLEVQAQEVTFNLHKMGTAQNGGVQDAHFQEAHAMTDLLNPTLLSENDNRNTSLQNIIPPTKIFKNEKTTDSESVFLNPNKRKESSDCEGWETINSSGSQSTRKNLQRSRMVVDKRLKTEILRGKISRREGLLAEISKTGVLLVEKAKKERLISKLLNQSSKQDIILTQRPINENLQLGEISEIKDFLGDSLSIEDILTDMCNLMDEKSDEDAFLAGNSTLLENQYLQETLLDKSSSESVLLTSYEQEEMHDLDVLGTQTYGTDLFKPVGGICNELNSVQVPLDQVFHEISGRDALPGLGLQGQEHELDPSMNQLESGNVGSDLSYVGLYEADCLNKSFRRECSENSKNEFAEQVHVGCPQWGGQDDQHLILDDSNWGDGRYIFGNMLPSSARLDTLESNCAIPSAGLAKEDGQRNEISVCRNLSRKGSEESSRKRCLGESCIERVHGLQEFILNDFLPVTTQSTTYHMLSSDAQCSSRGITNEEDNDEHRNIQPEDLSSLLEFLPRDLQFLT